MKARIFENIEWKQIVIENRKYDHRMFWMLFEKWEDLSIKCIKILTILSRKS